MPLAPVGLFCLCSKVTGVILQCCISFACRNPLTCISLNWCTDGGIFLLLYGTIAWYFAGEPTTTATLCLVYEYECVWCIYAVTYICILSLIGVLELFRRHKQRILTMPQDVYVVIYVCSDVYYDVNIMLCDNVCLIHMVLSCRSILVDTLTVTSVAVPSIIRDAE